jgi:hypothetical protein
VRPRQMALAVVALLAGQACTAAAPSPPPTGTAADSAAAAGFRALIAATPGARRYCLAVGNPAYYHEPGAAGVPASVDASPRLLALVASGRPPGAPPLVAASDCARDRPADAAGIEIDHLLPLGDSAVYVTATAGSRAGSFAYDCRVRRRRPGGRWVSAPCRQVGIFD